MTINIFPLSKSLTTTNLVVDSNVDMTGYDIKADNFNGNQASVDTVHATTIKVDHLGEHATSHTVVVDNTLAPAAVVGSSTISAVSTITAKKLLKPAASDNAKLVFPSCDGTTGNAILVYTRAWSYQWPYGLYGAGGTVRLKMTLAGCAATQTVQVYKNDTAGTNFNSDGAKAEDITVADGDILTLQCVMEANQHVHINGISLSWDEVAV